MNDPLISIIVPSRGRPQRLSTLLECLGHQKLDPGQSFEVIVALDGGADEERRGLPGGDRFPLQYLPLPQVGISAAKNAAVAQARGSILLLLNDDIEPEPDLVREHLVAQMAGGRIVLGDSPWRRFEDQTVFDELIARTRMIFFYGDLDAQRPCSFRHAWNLNLSFDRTLLGAHRDSPFNECFRPCMYEDLELAYRLIGEEAGIMYRPAARAVHHHRYTQAGYFEREAMLGVMAPELARANPPCFEAVFRCTLDELVTAARRTVSIDIPDALRLLAELSSWATRPAAACSDDQLRLLYHLHLPLKRRAFRAGLLAAMRRPTPPWPRRPDLARTAVANDPVFSDLLSPATRPPTAPKSTVIAIQ